MPTCACHVFSIVHYKCTIATSIIPYKHSSLCCCSSKSSTLTVKVFLQMSIMYTNCESFPTQKFGHIWYIRITYHIAGNFEGQIFDDYIFPTFCKFFSEIQALTPMIITLKPNFMTYFWG